MTQELTLTQAMIREHASAETMQRGREYYNEGAVSALTRRGNVVTAEVEGSEVEPYVVTATLPPLRESDATCDCPYEWGGWCKHIVAVLLAVLNEPETVQERAMLETLLATLDQTELNTVVRALVAQNPRLMDEIEAQIKVRKVLQRPAGELGRWAHHFRREYMSEQVKLEGSIFGYDTLIRGDDDFISLRGETKPELRKGMKILLEGDIKGYIASSFHT